MDHKQPRTPFSMVNHELLLPGSRAGGAGAAGAARAAPLLNGNIISSMGRGSAEPPKILLPYLQWPPHFSWASDAPAWITTPKSSTIEKGVFGTVFGPLYWGVSGRSVAEGLSVGPVLRSQAGIVRKLALFMLLLARYCAINLWFRAYFCGKMLIFGFCHEMSVSH